MKTRYTRLGLWTMMVLPAHLAWAGTEGSTNTLYGLGAGAINSSATSYNTFVGRLTGSNNTTGSHNVFFGFNAGLFHSTGANNTFLGSYAGLETTGSSDNTFVGYGAGSLHDAGAENTFVGYLAGYATTGFANTALGAHAGENLDSGQRNTFVGRSAGIANTTAEQNTFFGDQSGFSTNTGSFNTFVGRLAGDFNTTGYGNLFVGWGAGELSNAPHRLYIDDCYPILPCTSPLIYGEFDNYRLKLNGALNIRANGAAKSQLHFSQSDTDTGGWITSVLDNNFFVSSGARYDSGSWIQRSPDNKAVIAGSGGVGYRIFANAGQVVASSFTPTLRLHLDYGGNLGINTPAVAGTAIATGTGAVLTSGGVWTDASSRELKEHIAPLTADEAFEALSALRAVRYNYRIDPQEQYIGFIAEDVPELVARKGRDSLSPMDFAAVLAKVVSEQRRQIGALQIALDGQQRELEAQRDAFDAQDRMADDLAALLAQIENHGKRPAIADTTPQKSGLPATAGNGPAQALASRSSNTASQFTSRSNP